jgi:hypothetical protein
VNIAHHITHTRMCNHEACKLCQVYYFEYFTGLDANTYSGTSVHERLSSRTNRFTNKFSEKKKSRVTNTQAGNNGWRKAGSIGGRASVAV